MQGGSKRKRSDGPPSDDSRPSPHRPADTTLGQHGRDDGQSRGRRKPRGGGRRDSNSGHNRSASASHQQPNSSPTSRRGSANQQTGMPPPPAPTPVALAPAARPPPTPTSVKPDGASQTRPPYRYDNLTPERLSAWPARGRAEVVAHGIQSREDVDITELSSIFQEFIHAVVDNKIDPREAGSCVGEILGDRTEIIKDSYALSPHTLFLDSLAVVVESDTDLFAGISAKLRDFLIATEVPPTLMREVLEASLLQELGLLRDAFSKQAIRTATNLLYRQSNYNLLREETEGYSKLISEVYTICNTGPGPDPIMAEKTFERIKALIGTFDLDVGRVLDVTLDVAAAVLIKQYQFIVRLFRVSSWWPRAQLKSSSTAFTGGLPIWATPGYRSWTTSEEDLAAIQQQKLARDIAFWDRARSVHMSAYFELGGREATNADLERWTLMHGEAGSDKVAQFQQTWINETKTLPPQGNHVAAQLLGFKLRYYNSEIRGKDDVLPANLLYLAALLIKIGFLAITDLYPHLWPSDDDMESVREKALEELEKVEKAARGGPTNALLAAGVLPQGEDDNPALPPPRVRPTVKQTEEAKQAAAAAAAASAEKKPELSEPLEQKVRLMKCLLDLGALPEALFFLGRFPWIMETMPDIVAAFHRILHQSLQKVYNDTKPRSDNKLTPCPRKAMADVDQSGMPKGSVRTTELFRRKAFRWPSADVYDHKDRDAQDYRHYWDDWSDNIPQCQTVDDVFTLCNSLINISGVLIGKDESLLSKLARIGAKSMAEDDSPENMARWLELLKRLLLPALSQSNANVALVNAIWDLLKRYPLTTRYILYAEWFEGQISRLPAMRAAFARATSDTRGTMKRVSKENVAEMAKRMAKTSYSSPGVVFKVAFEQLESYPNLIDAFVGCAEFFTEMSYDVLVWSLMNSLGKSRSRTQSEHALTTSKWLQALSKFCGKVFRKYLALDPTPVLQYVNNQLFQGNSTDLIILKEFITSMGGIVDTLDFTDYQVLSMAGGSRLQRCTLIAARDLRFDNDRSSKRLIRALTDSGLAARLLINLAQFRQAAIFQIPEDEAHIKYLSSIVDDSHQSLIRYLDFLWSNLDPTTFESLIPSVPQLTAAFGLDTSLAFLISRPLLAHKMFPWSSSKNTVDENPKTEADKDGDVAMSEGKASSGAVVSTEAAATSDSQKTDDQSLIRTTLQPIVDGLQETVSPDIWTKISPELYTTFWALQLGDLFVPDRHYRQERDKLKTKEVAISRERTDNTNSARERRMEARKELMQQQIYLSEEASEHLLRTTKWKFYLMKQFQTSFPEPRAKPAAVADVLLEQCFLPRAVLSATDAEFTFRYIKALHEWNAPGFKLMALYDRLFNANRLRSLVFTSSVREAENLGRLLKLILADLSRWHKNDVEGKTTAKDQPRLGAYDKEGKGTAEQPRLGFALTHDENGKPATFVEHAQFKDMLFGWHKNLNTALKACLAGTEWMHIRNAITVLKTVLDHFPAVDFMANQFKAQLEKIAQQEASSKNGSVGTETNRVDLSVAAQGAMSELQRRKANWVMVQAFRPNANGKTQTETEKGAPSLRPTAPEFTPGPNKASAAEEEDGEVKDGRDSRSQSQQAPKSGSSSQTAASLPPKPTGPARDTPKRDATPVASVPRSSTPKAPTGPNGHTPRNDGRANTLPGPPHNLPSRPEVSVPSHYNTNRTSDRSREPRDPRDHRSRDSRDQRDGRSRDDQKDLPRPPREARLRDPDHSEHPRDHHDRRRLDGPQDPNRVEVVPRHASRSQRDGPRNETPEQPRHAIPASTPAPDNTSGPQMDPQRAALFAQDGPERPRGSDTDRSARDRREAPAGMVNPERAALIGDSNEDTPTRGPRDDTRARVRPLSPQRSGRQGQGLDGRLPEYGHDSRHGRGAPPSNWSSGVRDPRENAFGHGSHPGERPLGRDHSRGAVDMGRRDMSGTSRAGPFGPDPTPRAPYQDQNYGRLNADIPSPDTVTRGRGRVGGRNVSNIHPGAGGRPPVDSRQAPPEPIRPTDDRPAPPTGPASSRAQPRRGYEQANTPETSASTSAHASGGVHPDRLRNVGSQSDLNASPAPPTSTPGVHPDRLAHVNSRPQQSPGNHQNGPGRHTPYQTRTPDRGGPNMPPPPHAGDLATPGDNIVPTGPSSSTERRGVGGRRQLDAVNNMLQHSSHPGEGGRSSSSSRRPPRQMLDAGSDAQVLTGGSPATTPSQERRDPLRGDAGNRGPVNGDEPFGRGEHDRGHRESRSSRSRRSSREREGERGAGRDREGKDSRDHRDRRSGVGNDMERDPRRRFDGTERDPMGPPLAGGRESFGGRESRHSGRSSSTRDDRKGEDRTRKRRSEEGIGQPSNDREKRPRR